MSNTTPLDDQLEPLHDSAQLQALLERYEQWTNRDNFSADQRVLLRDSICNPTKTLWLHACRKALENNNTAWLQFYQHYDGGRERNFPLSTLDWDDLEKRRTHAAVCLVNCALAAAALKTATPDAVSQFVASFKNALIHWQASGNSKNRVPLRSQSPPPLLAIDSFLDEIKRLYASANEEFEVSPVETLIRHFLRLDSHRSQSNSSKTALFPLVFRVGGNAIALFEVDRYDHGTGRLYRDAVTSAFVIADDEFYESLQTAFEYIKNQNGDVENYDFYWRVRIWNRKTSGSLVDSRLRKQSAGLAATIAVNDSIRNSDLGAGYLFTGKVNSDGTFGVVTDLEDKINLAESNDLPIFIPRITDSNGRATRIVTRSDKVRLASSFVDVTQIIQSERQALKDENYRRLRRRRMIRIGIVAPIAVLSIVLGLILWGYSLEKKRRELAEAEKNIAERTSEELRNLTEALDTKNAELNDANALLDKANEELDSKNHKLTRTNAALEVATNEAVASEQEAQKLRQIAQASKQAAIASQFATEGYKRLVDGDKSGAQSYFAKALTFDDQEGYRTGLLNAYFDSGINSYKLAWSIDFGQNACCLKTAMSHSGSFLATTTLDRMQVRILKTDDGSQVSTVRLPKRIADIALSTNGEMLAAKADDGQVSVWKTGSQEKILEYSTQPDESQNPLAFSNDSIYLAVVSGAHSILVTEIASGKIVKQFDNAENLGDAKISYVTFIPGNVVYSFRYGPIIIAPVKNSGAPTRINAWNSHLGLGYTQRGELITAAADITVYPDITNKLGSVALPDFDSINQKVRNDWLIGSNSSIPYYSTTNDNGIIHIRMGSEVVGQIAFPMGKPVNLMLGSNGNLLFQNYEGKVFCWIPTPSNFKRFDNDDLGHEYGFFRRFRQEDNKLLVEDTKSRSIVFSVDLQVPEGKSLVVAISENGKYLAVSRDSQSVDIYDTENGAKKHHFELNVESDEKQIYRLAVSTDASKIAVVWPSSINVISSKTNEILGTVKFPLSFSEHFFVHSLTFSPQDTFLIVQTENSINLFDPSNCSLRHSIPFHQSGCYPEGTSCSWFAMSNDERFVALTDKNTGLAYVWNLDGTRHLVDVIETGSKSREIAVGAAFTSDNRYFVWSSGNSGRIHSYDMRKNRTLPDFLMDEGIENLLISKTNQLLIKGLQENYATDWNNLIYLMTASPSDINSNTATKTGFRIASSETALYSQEQLEQLLSNSRPTNQLLAVDRNGSDVQSFEMFGRTRVRRPPIGRNSSLRAKNTSNGPNQKPAESKARACPTGFAMPVFNPFPISFDTGNTSLCSDMPLLDVAEGTAYPKFSESMDQYLSTRRFPGAKHLVALLYMNNGGYSRPVSYVAKNVKITTAIERIGNVYKLTATYTGDNVAPASASVSIEVAPDERLEVIPNSGSMYNYVGQLILDRQRLDLGNSTFVLGDLDPDWQYSLFFSYHIAITKR